MDRRDELWVCRRCRVKIRRDDCAVRLGLIECPTCLRMGYVGLLQQHEPPARSGRDLEGR